MALEPARQSGTEVGAQEAIVVDQLQHAIAFVDAREGVGAIALGVDALVPIVKRRRRRLLVDLAGPRILPRRLVEVTVNDQRAERHRIGERAGRALRSAYDSSVS